MSTKTTTTLPGLKGEVIRVKEDDADQLLLAKHFTSTFRHNLAYVPGLGWHQYVKVGGMWVDKNPRIRNALDLLKKKLWPEAMNDERLLKALSRLNNASYQNGVLTIAQEYMARDAAEFDGDPWLLNVENGTIDLHTYDQPTFTLHKHSADLMQMKKARAAYHPELSIKESQWQRFLDQVVPDEDVQEYLQRYVGQALIGEVTEQVLMILLGGGRNGKGVFYGAIANMLGTYAGMATPDLLMNAEAQQSTGAVDLKGQRWVTVSETSEDHAFALSAMKNLTGGDRVKARRMHKDFIEFKPSHSLLMVTNNLPRVKSVNDYAVWERLRVVPFEVQIPREQRDPDLPNRLAAEADVILLWALEGLRAYKAPHADDATRQRGLDDPQIIRDRVAQYRQDEDPIRTFLAERCTEDKGQRTLLADFANAYNMGRSLTDHRSSVAMSRELQARGIVVRAGTGNRRFVYGWALNDGD